MKRLRLLLGLSLLVVALCAGVIGLVLSILRPERAPDEIVRARRPERRVVRVEAPPAGCAVTVEVADALGTPLPDARVTWSQLVRIGEGVPIPLPGLDAAGQVTAQVACGDLELRVSAPGHAPGWRLLQGDEDRSRPVRFVLQPGQRVYGTVTNNDGEPVAGATVMTNAAAVATTDADGDYALWTAAGGVWVTVTAYDHESGFGNLDAEEAPDAAGRRLDVVLERFTGIRVWCAGLPDDDCGDIPMQCTTPWSLAGPECLHDADAGETLCDCPTDSDEVAIRGGGRAVLVDADAGEAWLDFRDAGRIVGRVIHEGAPAPSCSVIGLRVPEALEDLPRGLVAARRARCEEDGSFVLEGLVPGDWEVVVSVSVEGRDAERVLVPRKVNPHATVDVGDVRLPGGGTIEGHVVDGLTGAFVPYAPVVAVREGAPGERPTIAPSEADGQEGFRLEGLPPGTWTVAHVLSPQQRVTVRVSEGSVSRVEVETSDATALDENGFALSDDAGALVVSDVTPGSPADEAGLEPGEEVVGVLVGGFDVAGAMGSKGAAFTRAILGSWDGPGVTLVVRNPDGEEEEVPLEW